MFELPTIDYNRYHPGSVKIEKTISELKVFFIKDYLR